MFKNEKGFTLIEILTVIAIIGILAVVLIPNLDSAAYQTKKGAVETDFRAMKMGIQQHYIDNRDEDFTAVEIQQYLDDSFTFVTPPSPDIDKYETTIKRDPWGNPYFMYIKNSGNRYVILQSYGPDERNSVSGNDFGDDVVFIFYPKN